MGWGDALAQSLANATDEAKKAASAVANSARSAYDYSERSALAGYAYVHNKAVQGCRYGREKSGQGYQAGKQAAKDAELAVIKSRYENARKRLGQNKAGSPVAMCPKMLPACAKLKEAGNKALLSADTYNDIPPKKGDLVGGYRRLDPNDPTDAEVLRKKLGLYRQDLEPDPPSTFRARVYTRAINGKTEYVIGFRGTTPTEADWRENVMQGLGGEQSPKDDLQSQNSYFRAIQVAKTASDYAERNGNSLSYTGHSLGGGMASAASAMTGNRASTYNAAGLNAHTVGGSYPDPPAPVDAYYTPTDPLSALQDNRPIVLGGVTQAVNSVPVIGPLLAAGIGGWVVRNEIAGTPVMPEAYGKRHVLPFPPGATPPNLSVDGLRQAHGMGLVMSGIEAERNELGCPR